jgi:SAM-dependent methyltransferase
VRFDIPLLPDITGLNIVHLQCHIATDTLSLARRGARSVTGLDFSPASLAEARKLAKNAAGGEKLSFVEGSLYDSLTLLNPASFDMVFTGVGALCWLSDIRKWAHVVASLLIPGGRFFIREAHPILWAMDDGVTDRLQFGYPYFERKEPTAFQSEGMCADDRGLCSKYAESFAIGTYMEMEDNDHKFVYSKTLEWNHGMAEIIQALLDEGMMITGLVEHRSLPWDALPGQMKECKDLPGKSASSVV